MQCSRCGGEIADHLIEVCRVTFGEQRIHPFDVRVGEVVCAMCWHELEWPTLLQNKEWEDDALDC